MLDVNYRSSINFYHGSTVGGSLKSVSCSRRASLLVGCLKCAAVSELQRMSLVLHDQFRPVAVLRRSYSYGFPDKGWLAPRLFLSINAHQRYEHIASADGWSDLG